MSSEPLVLGIETSCDETGVGIVRGSTLLADSIATSVDEQARFGGVVPEVASRAHLEAMRSTVERALSDAKVSLSDLDAIAVTAGPGLVGALLVGTATAQALSLATGKPLYGVNHLAAHVAVGRLEHAPLPQPAIALLVSLVTRVALFFSDPVYRKVVLGAGDTFRAAAIEQLQVWGERVGCEVIAGKPGGDPAAVAGVSRLTLR